MLPKNVSADNTASVVTSKGLNFTPLTWSERVCGLFKFVEVLREELVESFEFIDVSADTATSLQLNDLNGELESHNSEIVFTLSDVLRLYDGHPLINLFFSASKDFLFITFYTKSIAFACDIKPYIELW